MTVTQRRTTAWTLVWLCVLVISYASLYPFDDWRNQDLAPWSFVGAPWPRYNTAFDIWSNLLGYMPLGFWLCLAAMRSGVRRSGSLALGGAGAWALSFVLESAQSFLPMRVPSQLDWMTNSLGGILGAVLAAMLERRGWLYHWAQFRQHCLVPDAGGSLVLMVLWPLALLFPMSVPLGLGQVLARLRETVLQDFPEWQWLQHIPSDGFLVGLSPLMVVVCVALGVLVPALLGQSVLRKPEQRHAWVFGVVVAAVLFNALSAALTYGPAHAWSWLDASVFAGLAWGCLLALLALRLSLAWTLGGMLLAQLLLMLWVNQLTASVYLSQTVQTWEQGRFIRFHGLTQWLNWSWPWALLLLGSARWWRALKQAQRQPAIE